MLIAMSVAVPGRSRNSSITFDEPNSKDPMVSLTASASAPATAILPLWSDTLWSDTLWSDTLIGLG